ncbi:MAG: YdiY family protein [Limisphaerales bacterium]
MQKYVLAPFFLGALAICVHANTTNGAASASDGMTNHVQVWQDSLSFGLTLTRGNSDTLLTDGKFSTHRNNLTNEVTASIEGAYGEDQSVKNTELLHGIGQYNHLFTERVYAYGMGDAFHDGIADVNYRLTASPGAGYYFLKDKQTSLAGEAGPSAVFEKLDGGESQYYGAARLAERFEHKWDAHTRIWENVEFIPQFDMENNFLANAEIGAEASLTRRISLQTVLQDNFINVPASGHENNDLKLISGLVYKF